MLAALVDLEARGRAGARTRPAVRPPLPATPAASLLPAPCRVPCCVDLGVGASAAAAVGLGPSAAAGARARSSGVRAQAPPARAPPRPQARARRSPAPRTPCTAGCPRPAPPRA